MVNYIQESKGNTPKELKMKKINLLSKVEDLGIKEEYELVKQNKMHEAYQIRHARKVLTRFLCFKTKKDFYQALEDMTNYTIDKNGFWNYKAPAFIMDELTRNLLIDLKNKIAN